MADAADDRDLVEKSVRPVGPQAIPSRSGEAMRRLADLTYPLKPDGESRCHQRRPRNQPLRRSQFLRQTAHRRQCRRQADQLPRYRDCRERPV